MGYLEEFELCEGNWRSADIDPDATQALIDSEKEKVDGQGSYRPLEVRLPALCSSQCTYPPSPSLP